MKLLQISNYLYPHVGGIEQTARDGEWRANMGKAAKERAKEFSEETFGENVRRAVCSVCGVNG